MTKKGNATERRKEKKKRDRLDGKTQIEERDREFETHIEMERGERQITWKDSDKGKRQRV